MDRDSGAPDHFIGPRGDIYTLVKKRNKTNIITDDNADGNKEINRAIVSNSTKVTSDDNDDTSNNIKYNGSNIYEIVEIPGFITPSSSSASLLPPRPPSSSKLHPSSSSSPPHLSSSSSPPHSSSSSSSPPKREMCSEEEAQLQDLLTDLLGMANDLCGSLKINEAALTNNSTNPLNVAKHIELNHIKAASSDSGFHQQFSHDDESHSSIHPPIIHHSSIHPPFLHHSSTHPSINIPPINDIYCELEMPNIQHHHQQQHKQQHHHQQQQQQSYDEVDTDQRLDKKATNLREDQSSAQVIDDTISSEIENSKPLKENHYAILERDVINNNSIASPNNMKYKSNFVGQHFANPDLSEDGVVRSEVINIDPGTNGSRDNDSDNNYDHFDRYHNHHLHDLHYHNHHLQQQHHIQDYDYNNYNNYNNYIDRYDVTAPLNLHLDENTCSNCGMFFEDHNGHMCCTRDDDGEGVDDDFLSLPIDERSDSINSLISTPYANTPFGCSSSSSSSRNGRMEYKRNKGRKKIKEKEVVTLEPIGIGVQLLERYNYNTIDNPLQLNISDNDMFDTATPFYPNNHPPIHPPIQRPIHPPMHLPIQPPIHPPIHPRIHPHDHPYNHPSDNSFNTSTTKRHAPLAKSISSGYHGDRATLPDSQWDEGFYYSPQPQRNHFESITQRLCREEVSCQQQYMQDNGYQNHSSNNSLQNRFRQNSNNNNNNNNNNNISKLPARLRPKFNNANNKIVVGGYHRDVNNNNNNNNNNNYSINDAHPQHKHSSTQGLSIHPSSPHHHHHHHQIFNSFRPLNSSTHPPLTSSHSLQIHNGPEPGFEPATSSMPRSMKLITAKYHQISEPQLFRSVAIDSNMNPLEVVTTPCFVTDQSKRWYHPVMSREQAIKLLLNKQPGSFIIRNSNSFEGAYGLVMKVDKLPQQVTSASPCEYVRHFLIETTTAGVRIRGSPIEPTFGSLSTLVYQHMLTPLSLPCLLILNRYDDFHNAMEDDRVDGISQIIEETFYYVNSECTEGLTGQVAMSKVINKTFNNVCLAQFKVTKVKLRLDVEGLTLTDLERKLFFRKKYAWDCISYSGVDNSPKVYFARNEDQSKVFLGRLFCIVARNNALAKENVCHILASLRTQDHSFINVVEAINDRIPSSPR